MGQVLSGVLVFGDVRDAGAAIGRLVETGGRDGWLDLGLSIAGVVPLAGDLAKGFKVGKRTADVIGAAGDAGRAADAARAADDAARAADDAARAADDAARAADDLAPATTPGRRGSDCAANSFTGETPVLMADGGRLPIAALIPGDMVAAFDPISRRREPQPVTATITGSGVKRLVGITVDGHVITATDGHPFYAPRTGGWVDAGNLRPGERLLTAGGTWATVEAVRSRRATTTVHNLTVAEQHSYYVFAGPTAVLVHNTGPLRAGAGSGGQAGSGRAIGRVHPHRTGDIDPEALDRFMRSLPEISADEDALRVHAADALGRRPRDTTLTRINGEGALGVSGAPVHLLRDRAGQVIGVVKVFPEPEGLARELSALERLSELGLPHAHVVDVKAAARTTTARSAEGARLQRRAGPGDRPDDAEGRPDRRVGASAAARGAARGDGPQWSGIGRVAYAAARLRGAGGSRLRRATCSSHRRHHKQASGQACSAAECGHRYGRIGTAH